MQRAPRVIYYVDLMGFGPKGWGPLMLQATLMTIAVSSVAFLLGSVLGALIAWARIGGNRALQFAADVYMTVLRGDPRSARDLPALFRRKRRDDRHRPRVRGIGVRRASRRLPPARLRAGHHLRRLSRASSSAAPT